jgi:hypothetical protein
LSVRSLGEDNGVGFFSMFDVSKVRFYTVKIIFEFEAAMGWTVFIGMDRGSLSVYPFHRPAVLREYMLKKRVSSSSTQIMDLGLARSVHKSPPFMFLLPCVCTVKSMFDTHATCTSISSINCPTIHWVVGWATLFCLQFTDRSRHLVSVVTSTPTAPLKRSTCSFTRISMPHPVELVVVLITPMPMTSPYAYAFTLKTVTL